MKVIFSSEAHCNSRIPGNQCGDHIHSLSLRKKCRLNESKLIIHEIKEGKSIFINFHSSTERLFNILLLI